MIASKQIAELQLELVEIHKATFRAIAKFHRETECGKGHLHWRECEALCHALGFDDYDDWAAFMQLVQEGELAL